MSGKPKLYEGLNTREVLFVDAVLQGKTLGQSALEAGYSETSPKYVYTLIKKPRVAAAIEKGKQLALKYASIAVADIVEQYSRMAFLDLKDMMGEDGEIKNLKDLPESIRKTIIGFTKKTRFLKNGDYVTSWDYNFESRKGALDSLAEIAGLKKKEKDLDDPANVINSITDLVKAATEYQKNKLPETIIIQPLKTIDATEKES